MKTQDIYAQITEKIIRDLEKGVMPWNKPWHGESGALRFPLRFNGEPYHGINILILWSTATERHFQSRYWMTFDQAKKMGAEVRQGEKGTGIVFVSRVPKPLKEGESLEDEPQMVSMLRTYAVFNADQIDNLPEIYLPQEKKTGLDPSLRIEAADAFFRRTGAKVEHWAAEAFYEPASDKVVMPFFQQFKDPESYYSVLGHEMTHWTGHVSRLNRRLEEAVGELDAYAFEELIAELGAAFLCAELELTQEPRPDHAQYIGAWLRALKNDVFAIGLAATQAQRAVQFLHGLQ